jgi:hypothetical protein
LCQLVCICVCLCLSLCLSALLFFYWRCRHHPFEALNRIAIGHPRAPGFRFFWNSYYCYRYCAPNNAIALLLLQLLPLKLSLFYLGLVHIHKSTRSPFLSMTIMPHNQTIFEVDDKIKVKLLIVPYPKTQVCTSLYIILLMSILLLQVCGLLVVISCYHPCCLGSVVENC